MRALGAVALLVMSLIQAMPADAAVTVPPGSIIVPTSGTFLYVLSQPGDHVGQGIEALYRPTDSIFKGADLTPNSTGFRKLVYSGPMLWDVRFGTSGDVLSVGQYPVPYPTTGGAFMSVGGIGGCGSYSGEFDVNALTFSDQGDLLLFDASFEQHCDGASPALFGRIRIEQPAPTPGVTLPAGNISIPSTGSFLYLNSEPGDYIGAGLEQLFTATTPTLPSLQLVQGGDIFQGGANPTNALTPWTVMIAAPRGVPLTAGSYVRAVRIDGERPAGSPGLDVFGDGRGCGATTGKFDVDQLSFAPSGDLLVFQATFQQFCDYSSRALYGRIRIENPAPTNVVLPPGSINVPTTGSFLYVNSQAGDPIGLGAEALYTLTSANATDELSSEGDVFTTTTTQSGHAWIVTVAAPLGQTLVTRLYTRAVLVSARTATSPGMQVFEDDRSCTNISGKFAVDELSFWPGGDLKVLQATFEQYCNGSAAALYARLRVENPAPLQLTVTLREEGSVSNKTGVATIGGTISCARPASVALSGLLTQAPPNHDVVTGSFSVQVDCGPTTSKWSATVYADVGRFAPGDATGSVDARTCQLSCYTATTTRVLQLNAGK